MNQVSYFERQKADLEVKTKVASILTVRRVQELLYFVAEMPCDESVLCDLEELIKELKVRDSNALIELERLLMDIIMMFLSLIFKEVTHEFLFSWLAPVSKRYELDFGDIGCVHIHVLQSVYYRSLCVAETFVYGPYPDALRNLFVFTFRFSTSASGTQYQGIMLSDGSAREAKEGVSIEFGLSPPVGQVP